MHLVLLKVGKQNINYQFRVESFLWDTDDDLNHADSHVHNSLARITRLKTAIEGYDKSWELIQIFTPSENSKFIQVLYRKRS